MTYSIGRLAATAVLGCGLLLVVLMGALASTAFSAADGAAAPSGPAEGADTLRLIGILLVVMTPFLLGFMVFVAIHATALVRDPLRDLLDAMQRIATGGAQERIAPAGPLEVQGLSDAVNRIAASLDVRDARSKETATLATIDDLIAGIAHEVNTPLTYMFINQGLIERNSRALAQRTDVPEDVRETARRQTRMHERDRNGLERLRLLSRALREVTRDTDGETGRDINLLVSAAIAITHHRFPAGVRFQATLAATEQVDWRSSELFHALHQILLTTAGIAGTEDILEVQTRDEADAVCITVSDRREVLPVELLELLDETPRGAGGPREGLVGVRDIIERHGGTFGCLSAPGRGTRFTMRLPRIERTVAAQSGAGTPREEGWGSALRVAETGDRTTGRVSRSVVRRPVARGPLPDLP